MYLPLSLGVLCWSLFWCALLCVISSFAIILMRKRELVAKFFFVFRMSCYCKCSVALPDGAVGRSAVCECGFFWSYMRFLRGQNFIHLALLFSDFIHFFKYLTKTFYLCISIVYAINERSVQSCTLSIITALFGQ